MNSLHNNGEHKSELNITEFLKSPNINLSKHMAILLKKNHLNKELSTSNTRKTNANHAIIGGLT